MSQTTQIIQHITMALQIEPLAEKDLDNFIQLYWKAFEPLEADMVAPMMYPSGLSQELQTRMRNRILPDVGPAKDLCFVAREESSGSIVAIARWGIVSQPPSTPAEADVAFADAVRKKESEIQVEGENEVLSSAYFKASWYAENEVVAGRPYMTLRLLAADPLFGRRGAGTALLVSGLDRADDQDLPVFLSGATMGKPLYEKFGFRVLKTVPFDGRDYGGRSAGTHWCMWRPKKSERSNK